MLREEVTRSPAAPTASARWIELAANSCESASRAPKSAVRALSAFTTIASRSRVSSSISNRIRRSFSVYDRSRFVTSVRTITSSSPARVKARSMPSPIEAASRRIACESATTCSVAIVSGSINLIATSVMELAISRISCARRAINPVMNKNAIGPINAPSASIGFGERSAPPGSIISLLLK